MRRFMLIVIPLVLLGLVVVAWVAQKSKPSDRNVANLNLADVGPDGSGNTNRASDSSATSAREEVVTVSRAFSERYGSSSSDAPNGHLAAALPFVSLALQSSFQRVLSRPPSPSEEPTLITSRAFAFDIRSLDEKAGRAEVAVWLQRKELVGTQLPVVYQQNLSLSLVKEQGAWKVNLAVWGGKQE